MKRRHYCTTDNRQNNGKREKKILKEKDKKGRRAMKGITEVES